ERSSRGSVPPQPARPVTLARKSVLVCIKPPAEWVASVPLMSAAETEPWMPMTHAPAPGALPNPPNCQSQPSWPPKMGPLVVTLALRLGAGEKLVLKTLNSRFPQPQPTWAPVKQPVQLNTGIGGATGATRGAFTARSAAMAGAAASNAVPATPVSKVLFNMLFIRAPKVSGLNQGVASPNGGDESNGKPCAA